MDFKNHKILVTGSNGFFGSWIVKKIKKRGIKTVGTPRSKNFDLTTASDCSVLLTYKNTIVIHAAGLVGGIGFNQAHPAEMFSENMQMGLNMIKEAAKRQITKFVLIGTVCAYPKFTPVPFSEDYLWKGFPEETNAPYGVAKRALLTYLQACRQQYGLNGIYLLPVNLYGPGDHFEEKKSHVIPALIKRIAQAKDRKDSSVTIWGSGRASREFLYVEDAARAIVMAAERYDKPEPINIGSGMEITIVELVALLCRLMKYKGNIKWDTSKPDGQPRRCLDTSRAEKEFGFKAETDFEEGLSRTIDWYYKNISRPVT